MPRKRKSVSLDETVIAYIERKIKDGTYYNFSHALESIIKDKMKEEKSQ